MHKQVHEGYQKEKIRCMNFQKMSVIGSKTEGTNTHVKKLACPILT